MKLNEYLDSTYLKTTSQAGLSQEATREKVIALTQEAIEYDFKLIMIRPEFIEETKKIIEDAKSNVLVGTVIGFHEGAKTVEEKLSEAQKAIQLGADELDFVINYSEFKKGNSALIQEEVLKCSQLCLENNKIVKWIVEVAALTNQEIIVISQCIRDLIIDNFGEEKAKNVFVKSSTGFYKTENNKPNGATFETMELIIENSAPLSVKAAGGVKDYKTALKMIKIGVDRIGTSSAKQLIGKLTTTQIEY
jgi:deoxyribose-phosphate aldolase